MVALGWFDIDRRKEAMVKELSRRGEEEEEDERKIGK